MTAPRRRQIGHASAALIVAFAVGSCAPTAAKRTATPPSPLPRTGASPGADTRPSATPGDYSRWAGIYCSPGEIAGYSRTILALEPGLLGDGLAYRIRSFSHQGPADHEEQWGTCLVESDTVYVPVARVFSNTGKPRLMAHVDRYTLRTINNHIVLMRDDALQAFDRHDSLYDYGILIRAADARPPGSDLEKVRHPSIKLLYADPSKPWRDPFVSGPNDR